MTTSLIRSTHHVIAMNPAERQPTPHEERQNGDGDELVLPQIPKSDLSFDLSSVIGPNPDQEKSEKIQKRASNVMKLAQENENLKAELKALTDRLEAAKKREGKLMEDGDMQDTLKHP